MHSRVQAFVKPPFYKDWITLELLPTKPSCVSLRVNDRVYMWCVWQGGPAACWVTWPWAALRKEANSPIESRETSLTSFFQTGFPLTSQPAFLSNLYVCVSACPMKLRNHIVPTSTYHTRRGEGYLPAAGACWKLVKEQWIRRMKPNDRWLWKEKRKAQFVEAGNWTHQRRLRCMRYG